MQAILKSIVWLLPLIFGLLVGGVWGAFATLQGRWILTRR